MAPFQHLHTDFKRCHATDRDSQNVMKAAE